MKWVVEVKTRKCSKDTAIACLEVMEAALYDSFFFFKRTRQCDLLAAWNDFHRTGASKNINTEASRDEGSKLVASGR